MRNVKKWFLFGVLAAVLFCGGHGLLKTAAPSRREKAAVLRLSAGEMQDSGISAKMGTSTATGNPVTDGKAKITGDLNGSGITIEKIEEIPEEEESMKNTEKDGSESGSGLSSEQKSKEGSVSEAESEQGTASKQKSKQESASEIESESENDSDRETEHDPLEERVEKYLKKLTIEEKAAQLFVVLPEQLTGANAVTAAGDTTKAAFDSIPVGGFIYMEQNLVSEGQIKEMLSNVQKYSRERVGLPVFTCVDEEGGTVSRINGRGIVDAPYIGDMSEIGQTEDFEQAYQIGAEIGGYLSQLGFNVDFAPVTDVLSNPANTVVRYRSFGSDTRIVTGMTVAELSGLRDKGVYGTMKHFPGHGATEGDTHEGYAYSSKTLDEMRHCELIPFQEGIIQGADFIMVGHISLPNVTGDNTPASLSYEITTGILREEMGYDGIVVTDALNMGAISQGYSSADASVRAIQAGADLILMPSDVQAAYYGVLDAVKNGSVSEERINESVKRILKVKLDMVSEQETGNGFTEEGL